MAFATKKINSFIWLVKTNKNFCTKIVIIILNLLLLFKIIITVLFNIEFKVIVIVIIGVKPRLLAAGTLNIDQLVHGNPRMGTMLA